MPPNPYPAGSPEYNNFVEINRIRIAGGFGAMVEDPVMRKAAIAHDNYEVLVITAGLKNPNESAHAETPGLPGFTGIDPQARCESAAVGTDAAGRIYCGEVRIGSSAHVANLNVPGNYGSSGAVGHMQILMDYTNNHCGIHMAEDTLPGDSPGSYATIVVGNRTGEGAHLASDQQNTIVGIYPFDGMTGVGVGVPTNSYILPTTILVQTSAGLVNPVVTTFTLRKDGATTDWPTRLVNAGDPAYGPGTEPTFAGWGIMMPSVVLDPNSKYNVTFKGTLQGVPISKTWSFTTGTTTGTDALGRMGG